MGDSRGVLREGVHDLIEAGRGRHGVAVVEHGSRDGGLELTRGTHVDLWRLTHADNSLTHDDLVLKMLLGDRVVVGRLCENVKNKIIK